MKTNHVSQCACAEINGKGNASGFKAELEQRPASILSTFVANDTSGKRQKESSSVECGPTTYGLIYSDTKKFTEFLYAEKVNRSHNPFVATILL